VKILVTTSPDSLRLVTAFPPMVRWYINAVPPATIGMYAYVPAAGFSAADPSVGSVWNGISLTAKSTVPFRNCRRPSDDPFPE